MNQRGRHFDFTGILTDDSELWDGPGSRIILLGGDDIFGANGSYRHLADGVSGGAGNDSIWGGDSYDVLKGDDGRDRLFGGGNSDVLFGGAGGDFAHGGAHDDEVYGGAGGDILFGDAGNERLLGQIGNDRLYGGLGADRLLGKVGADLVHGGAGRDKIDGEAGNDTLSGDAGNDVFIFSAALDATNTVDLIQDFEIGQDKIGLAGAAGFAFASLANGILAASAFKEVGAGILDNDDRILYDQALGKLYFDADGSGSGQAVLFAQVTPGLALTNADILVSL